jgi:CIC family chloride channel protein
MRSSKLDSLGAWGANHLDEVRIRLARPNALMSLSLLGLLTGVLAGGVIVLFRLAIEGAQELVLPGQGMENFEALGRKARFLLPVLAALLLAAMFRWFSRGIHVVGVAHVLERMDRYQGRISSRAFILQFCGAVLAIAGGHSVGREGPSVFLGAASGSLLAKRLALPHNVIRTLAGCGAAAAIAASFNTPLAGVVFALEVVMMEYTVSSFIPVILSAVSATAVCNVVFGDHPVFTLPSVHIGSLWDLVPVVLLGIAAGVLSATFIQSVQTVAARGARFPFEVRLVIAGVMMGGMGVFLPQVMGMGYDSVDAALHGGFTLSILFLLLFGKVLATSLCIGLGVPGGSIGPVLFIGAMLGALFAGLSDYLPLMPVNKVGLFALLGMGAMMSGSLQAPLAALVAMLELTDNPQIILPGMLVVVISGLTASEVFGKESMFVTMLRAGGFRVDNDPLAQAQRRIGVASAMDRSLVQVGPLVSHEQAGQLLETSPRYLLVGSEGGAQVLMPASHLASFLAARDAGDSENIDLLAIPAKRWQVAAISLQANLQEAADLLEQAAVEALVVQRRTAAGNDRVFGVLTPEMVESAYRD